MTPQSTHCIRNHKPFRLLQGRGEIRRPEDLPPGQGLAFRGLGHLSYAVRRRSSMRESNIPICRRRLCLMERPKRSWAGSWACPRRMAAESSQGGAHPVTLLEGVALVQEGVPKPMDGEVVDGDGDRNGSARQRHPPQAHSQPRQEPQLTCFDLIHFQLLISSTI
jgi:hypothetical protein